MMKKIIYNSVLFCFIIPHFVSAQFFDNKVYPKYYFQWPVETEPGIVANFGELRPNHYHMGLDCRTESRVNMPILAAADGYVSKINIDPTGFGRALYISHPNRMTTLYAHLNDFSPEIENYIQEQQYKLQQWKLQIDVPTNLLKVTKGELIARSGNTGGSQGPHLHFEVRDTKTDKVLNPLLMGFPIEDNIPPVILKLAVYDRCYSTYEQSPKIYTLKKVNGMYQPLGGKIKVNTNKVSFAISAFDKYTGSTNQNGIFSAVLFNNGKAISGFAMDSISYDETRYLNAHIDFKTRNNGGPFLQHVSPLPGYQHGIYKTAKGENGNVNLETGLENEIKIAVSDAAGNVSNIIFTIKDDGIREKRKSFEGLLFEPNNINVFENDKVSFYMKDSAIYDSFHFKLREVATSTGPAYYLQDDEVPVQQYYPIKIKGNFKIEDTGKIEMKLISHGKTKFKKAVYKNGWHESSFRDFGVFQLVLDKTPPVVAPLWGFRDGADVSKINKIAFSAIDNTNEIVDFTGSLDGQWLLFSNDKGKTFIYDFDKNCTPGEHSLVLIVKDVVGNTTRKVYRFRR
jgi:murein DD-endopeptidase MepM/ murein hydrolase activator NlpD